jgi:putative membrane protein insertion efficiency factor
VPTLRERLKRPETYLLFICLLGVLAVLDSSREPPKQVTSSLYVHAVRVYQHAGRPVVARYIRCRFRPSCSEYSIDAVEKYGIKNGLFMTVRRIHTCTPAVAFGTYDPVP